MVNSFIRIGTVFLFGGLLTVSTFGAEDEKAPVHPRLISAETIYLLNDQDDLPAFDRLYSDLRKWGRYQVVETPEEAEILGVLTMQIGRTFEIYTGSTFILGSSAINIGSASGGGYKHFYFKIFDMDTKSQLWIDGQEGWWTNKGAISKIVRTLRNRLPKDTVIEVFEKRAIWKNFRRPFLEALAKRFNSVKIANNFALFCEESGILENYIRKLSEYGDPELVLDNVAVTLTSYGNTMGEQGEVIKAKEGLEFALVLNPNYVQAWLGMATVSVSLGDCMSAVNWTDKVLNFRPDPNSENSWTKAMASEDASNKIRNQMEAIKATCK